MVLYIYFKSRKIEQVILNLHMLKIYVHVATFGTYQDVINNFYSRIAASGLYDKVDSINLMINGNIKDFNLDIMPKKYNVVHLLDNYDRLFEFSTLNALWLDCNKNPDMTVIYLHTKGISHLNSETIKDWVNYLAYFNINRWKDRINDLQKKIMIVLVLVFKVSTIMILL